MEKPNRAERRKNKFGGGRASEHGGWPTHQPNPVFEVEGTEPDAPTPAHESSVTETVEDPTPGLETPPA